MKLLAHLKDIVALLRVAKDILESGLEDEDVETVKIEDRGGLALPEKLNRNLELFTKIATDQIREAGDGIAGELTGMADEQKIASTTNEATEKLAGLFNSWMELQTLQTAEHANKKAYERDLDNLKAQFRKEWDAIDKKAEALGDIMARINTAATDEERKRGLMQLADIGDDWSDDDWDKFLSGKKDLVI